MAEVLNQILPEGLAEQIAEYAAPDVEWETVYGSKMIWRTKHFITYDGGPEGGYVYFYKEREAGWYKWERGWFQPPTYTEVDGQIAIWWDDDRVERIGVVPHDYEPDEDKNIVIMDDEIMQGLDDE
jgi:hypothetical protein